MISKITHLLKYGIIGCIAGGAIKILSNLENPSLPLSIIFLWAGVGTLSGMLVSLVMERWFNEKYRD